MTGRKVLLVDGPGRGEIVALPPVVSWLAYSCGDDLTPATVTYWMQRFAMCGRWIWVGSVSGGAASEDDIWDLLASDKAKECAHE
jgi:hypothetical protein